MAKLRLAPVAPGRLGGVAFQHGIAFRRIQTLQKAPAMRIKPHGQPPSSSQFRKAPRNRQAIGYFPAKVIHQHGQVLIREGFMEHFSSAHRAAGIADQRMGHGAIAARSAEPMGGRVIGIADKALGPFSLRGAAADGSGIGHHILHFRARAVARFHRQKCGLRQFNAHLIGVMRRNTGRTQLLQQHGFQIHQLHKGTADIKQGIARADPLAFFMHHFNLERGAARRRHGTQPIQHQPRRRNHRAAQKHRIAHFGITKALHHGLSAVEIAIGAGGYHRIRHIGRRRKGCSLPAAGRVHCAAWAGAVRPATRRAFNSSAIRNASSSDCSALSLGSQEVA